MGSPILPIYRKPMKRKKNPVIRNRERYHRYRALGKVPTRYKSYAQMSDEERETLARAVVASKMRKYHSNLKYRNKVNSRRTLDSLRQRQRERGDVKACTKCLKVEPFANYERRSSTDTRLRSECKTCRKKRNKLYYEQNRDKHKTDGEWNVQIRRKNDN